MDNTDDPAPKTIQATVHCGDEYIRLFYRLSQLKNETVQIYIDAHGIPKMLGVVCKNELISKGLGN